MRKKLMSAALATAMALSVTACTSNPADKTTAAPAETKAEAAETTVAAAEEKKGSRRRTDHGWLCTGRC